MNLIRNFTPPLSLVGAVLSLAVLLLPTAVQAEGNAEDSATTQVIQLPGIVGNVGSGAGKEVATLIDQSHLKLAIITLRRGTVLASHSTPVPATILVLQGAGVMNVGGEAIPASKGTIVSLGAGEQHDIVPEPGSNMLLLVHYLRGVGEEAPAEEHNH